MSGICIRCGMLSKSLASNATCPECNANAQHYIGVGEKRMAQAIAELKERNRKQDDDIIDMREAIQKRDAEIAALTEQTYRLGEKWMEEQSARASERDESRAEIAALRDVVSLQGSALREIRIRLHAAGRRPEECYEMSILDDTIAAVRRALEAAK